MTEMQIIWLSLLQGITEFLPVSSSGHLILFSKFTEFPDQGAAMDIALHIGSIFAVIIYFAPTLWEMLKGLIKTKFLPNTKVEGAQLFYLLLVATLPVLCCGAALKFFGTDWLRSTKLIGWNILIYALILWLMDTWAVTIRKVNNLEFKDALFIGLAQCLALIPGTSRSGITITMARFLGLERTEAAKFSMLLSIPAIIGATSLVCWKIVADGNFAEIAQVFDGVVYSYAASIIAIYIVMWWLKKSTFFPFVVYRIALGVFLLLDSYGYLHILFQESS